MVKHKQQVTVADTLLKESTPQESQSSSVTSTEPRIPRRERERQEAREFHQRFIQENGGYPVELGTGTWALPSGARIVESAGSPRYLPAPAQSRARLYWQLGYYRSRIEAFDYAIGTLANIVEGEQLMEEYEQNRTDTRVTSLPSFTWDAKLFGPAPMQDNPDGTVSPSGSSKQALGVLKIRRNTLAKRLEKLMQEPEAAGLVPDNGIFAARINAVESRKGQ